MGLGILREYFCFEWSVLSRAFKDTLQFAKQHLAIEALFIVFGAVAGALMSPLDYSQWLNGLIIGVITVVLMFITIGLWNLGFAPFQLWKDQKELITPGAKISPERLERIFEEGQALLSGISPHGLSLFSQQISLFNRWIDKSEKVVSKDAPQEAFLYRTITTKIDKKLDTRACVEIMQARLGKLRLIIGSMQ